MLGVTDMLFGWMPPLLALLAHAALIIYIGCTIIMLIKFIKDLVSLI